MTSTAAATSSLVDLKRACALLTRIACGHKHPYAHLDGVPSESFDALVVAIPQLELAAASTREGVDATDGTSPRCGAAQGP
jgi:hypothetical protein